jgi:uncharacterized membrane protein
MTTLRTVNIPQPEPEPRRPFPTGGGVLLGLGLGGFFDGIVLHQILQWHHMASSAGVPVDTVPGLRMNTLLDGLFHAATYVFVVLGIVFLWRGIRRGAALSGRALVGSVLMGFGLFNLIEGLANHQILGLHHVNETVPPEQWIWWDLGFLASGMVLLAIGYALRQAAPDARGSVR